MPSDSLLLAFLAKVSPLDVVMMLLAGMAYRLVTHQKNIHRQTIQYALWIIAGAMAASALARLLMFANLIGWIGK